VLAHQNRLLDLGLLDVAFLTHLHDSLAVVRRQYLVVLHLVHLFGHFLIVALFELEDFGGTLPGLLDLLASLDLLLLEEGDAVRQQLRIALHILAFLLGDKGSFASGAGLRATLSLLVEGVGGGDAALVHLIGLASAVHRLIWLLLLNVNNFVAVFAHS